MPRKILNFKHVKVKPLRNIPIAIGSTGVVPS